MPGKWLLVALLLISANPLFAQNNSPNLQIDGSYRLRYESLDNAFRANGRGGDQLLASRLLLSLKARGGPSAGGNWFGELEWQDARAWLDDAGTPLGTDDVNSLEPLQAYAGWRRMGAAGGVAIKAGRFTLDIGSRRLVARNRFRNTLNAFTGIHADWTGAGWRWQGFYTLPVQRRPNARSELDDNDAERDQTFSKVRFWGAHGTRQLTATVVELYVMALEEDDQRDLNTADQNIYSVGGRLLKSASVQQWDYEVEAVYQFGASRGSTAPADIIDLDHRAAFLHGQLGYQFADSWNSRILLQVDYASGDENTGDRQNNRFTTLFGARRFDFGPTGIYGPIARGNVATPGLRWEFAPTKSINGFVGYRAFWLAQRRGGLSATGLRDDSGQTGNFVGQQWEMRVRIAPIKNWQLEAGAAYLDKGEFLRETPNAPTSGDTSYWYGSISYLF